MRLVSPGPVNFVYCTNTSGANTLTIPASGRLGPGTYSFEVFTGKSVADTVGSRSFNYVLRFQTEVTGACCNRWTGHCAVMTSGDCAAVGLRFDGAASTCSSAACSACPADFNTSGSLSVQDIFDFLAAYFAGCV